MRVGEQRHQPARVLGRDQVDRSCACTQARSSERSSVAGAVDVGGGQRAAAGAEGELRGARLLRLHRARQPRTTSAGWRTDAGRASSCDAARMTPSAPGSIRRALKSCPMRLAEQALDARVALDLEVAVVEGLAASRRAGPPRRAALNIVCGHRELRAARRRSRPRVTCGPGTSIRKRSDLPGPVSPPAVSSSPNTSFSFANAGDLRLDALHRDDDQIAGRGHRLRRSARPAQPRRAPRRARSPGRPASGCSGRPRP